MESKPVVELHGFRHHTNELFNLRLIDIASKLNSPSVPFELMVAF